MKNQILSFILKDSDLSAIEVAMVLYIELLKHKTSEEIQIILKNANQTHKPEEKSELFDERLFQKLHDQKLISTNLYYCLKRANVKSLYNLSKFPLFEIKKFKRLGIKTLNEVKNLLEKYNLTYVE